MAMLVGRKGVFRNWPFEGKALFRVHVVEVFRHGSIGVTLDDEVDMTLLIYGEKVS